MIILRLNMNSSMEMEMIERLNNSCFASNLSRNNITAEQWTPLPDWKRYTRPLGAILVLFFLVGTPWNIFVIVGTIYKRLYVQPTHILLLNLAVTNILFCVLVMPFGIVSGLAGEFVFGNSDYDRCQVCKTAGVLYYMLSEITLHTIALLALDRFIYIKYALKYDRIVTVRRACAAIAMTWVLSILLATPPLYRFGEIIFFFSCVIAIVGETELANNIHYGLFLGVETIIPVSIIIVTNVWVMCIALKQVSKWKKNSLPITTEKEISKKINLETRKKQMKLIKVFAGILSVYLINYSFVVVVLLVRTVTRVHVIGYALSYLSLLMNPIQIPVIESFFLPELRGILTRCGKREKINSTLNT